jgi:hypothetical protein
MFPSTTLFSGNTPLAGEHRAAPNNYPSSLKTFANIACNSFLASPVLAVGLRSPLPIAVASIAVLSAAGLTDLWKMKMKGN